MPLFLHNTLTRSADEFIPLVAGKAGLYVCGPTVYGRAHVGNLRSWIFSDTLRRVLQANDYTVTEVMNITDVGHLVGDGDEGVDKLQMAADKVSKTAWDVAVEFTKLFVEDIKRVNIEAPHVMPKATDHIAEQLALIEAMEAKGFIYAIGDGIYFDTAKLPEYGQLSRQKNEDKEEGARVVVNAEKRSPSDFALWKFSPAGEQRHMEWESPWGKGFPGWHLECSAMSEKYLGVPFDLHTGGVDHIAVHHENEIAQTLAARGVLEANYWLHNEFMLIDGGKMSKSLGNVYSLDDLDLKSISPLAFRYFVLGAHYRTQINFTWEGAKAAQNALNNLIDLARDWQKPSNADEVTMGKFMLAVNNDLDTPAALAVLWNFVNDNAVGSDVKAATVLKMDEVLGLALEDVVARPVRVTEAAQKLLDEREVARIAKDWERSDLLRDELFGLGYAVEDKATGQHLRERR
ncbi:TPA: cysteine--tRNA ligase [Candidatus Uhrbacteria bacterium]|nr:cysteine--tRNA ligase [Candidatus Uhrbacteria bacterium]